MRGGIEQKGLNDEIFKKDYANMHLLNWKNWIATQSIELFGINEWNYYFDEDSLFNAEVNLLQPCYNNI